MPQLRTSATEQVASRYPAWLVFLLALFGTYANVAAYGFQYPAGTDYSFLLPLANWLRNPALYPSDRIRDVFPHVQTFYWPLVAMLSKSHDPERVLFALFLITKLLFFGAVSFLIATRVRSRLLGACMVGAIAISVLLNGQTPIGGTITLEEIAEHAGLGLTIVLLAGVLLVEGRWLGAAVIAGLSVYVDAIQFVHILPAFALFAIVDWRERKRQVVTAGLLGAAVFLPWFVHFHRSFLTNYPTHYVAALLIHYPLHITLRWTPASQVIEAVGIVFAAACMGLVGRRARLTIERRLELLAASYLAVTLVGVILGLFWLTPTVARFMPQRADSLLLPYALLLIQIYGATLLESSRVRGPATTCLVAVLAILLPLSSYLVLFLLAAVLAWLDPRQSVERGFAAVFGRFRKSSQAISTSALAVGLCATAIGVSFFLLLSSADQLWDFRIPPSTDETACYDAQLWARDHTATGATFMVPPAGCGFRVFSERASWGEWSDGNAMYFNPAFADTFLKRVAILDPSPVPRGLEIIDSVTEAYKNQTWERIRAVAEENQLDYIVQVRSTAYPAEPVYANSAFAIYKAH